MHLDCLWYLQSTVYVIDVQQIACKMNEGRKKWWRALFVLHTINQLLPDRNGAIVNYLRNGSLTCKEPLEFLSSLRLSVPSHSLTHLYSAGPEHPLGWWSEGIFLHCRKCLWNHPSQWPRPWRLRSCSSLASQPVVIRKEVSYVQTPRLSCGSRAIMGTCSQATTVHKTQSTLIWKLLVLSYPSHSFPL